MKHDALISVIVPVYKAERYLEKCVRSILGQTYRNLEVILVDDGSPDRSGEICDAFEADDSRVRVIHQKNGGVSAARNAGLDSMTGEYFCFVDSDDYAEREMIAKLHEAITSNDVDLAICGYNKVTSNEIKQCHRESGVLVGKEIIARFALAHYLDSGASSPWGKLYKNCVQLDLRFDRSISMGEDLKFNIQFFETIEKMAIIEDCLYNYVDCAGSLTNSYKAGYYEGICDLYETTIGYIQRVFFDTRDVDLSIVNYKLISCCGIFMVRNHLTANKKIQKSFIKKICNNPQVQRAARDLPPMSMVYHIFAWAINCKMERFLYLLSWIKCRFFT